MGNNEFNCRSSCLLNLPSGFNKVLTQRDDSWSNQFKYSVDVDNACVGIFCGGDVKYHLRNCLDVRDYSHFIFFINFQILLSQFILSICLILICFIVKLNILNYFWIFKKHFESFWCYKIFIIVSAIRRKSPARKKHFNGQIWINFDFRIFNLRKAHNFRYKLNTQLYRHKLECPT